MSLTLHVIDAFTNRPFAGNPAAVCLLPEPRDAAWMQRIAHEMNLSETAFLHQLPEGFALRWFTPATEVDLCGHATLASAHALWETGVLKADEPAIFLTRSGRLSCLRVGDWIAMDFPATPVTAIAPEPELAEELGAVPVFIGRTAFDLFVEIEDEDAVRGLRPDLTRLSRRPFRGVIVTAWSSTPDFAFVSRFFAPACGINEDPVTGSAHCALGPYWQAKLGRSDFMAYQASARGGTVKVSVRGERVLLGGQAVTVSRIELFCE